MPISPDDDSDISNALNLARQDIGGGNAIQAKVGGLNQALTGLDLEANTPQFHTGIGGAGMPSAFKRPTNDEIEDHSSAIAEAMQNYFNVPVSVSKSKTPFGVSHYVKPQFDLPESETPFVIRVSDHDAWVPRLHQIEHHVYPKSNDDPKKFINESIGAIKNYGQKVGLLPKDEFVPLTGDVYHQTFGKGTIIDSQPDVAKVDFGDKGIKNISSKFLQPVADQNINKAKGGRTGYATIGGVPTDDIAQAIATARQPDLVTEDDVAGTWSPRSLPTSGQTINSYSPSTEVAPLSFKEKLPKVLYNRFVDPMLKAVTAPGRVYRGEVPESQMIDEAKNVAGQLMTGSFATGVPTALREGVDPNVLRTFAGPASKTADIYAQRKAGLLKDVYNQKPEEIWRQTGWMRDPADLNWMYEIKDPNFSQAIGSDIVDEKGYDQATQDWLNSIPKRKSVTDVAGDYFEQKTGQPRSKMFTGQNTLLDDEALAYARKNPDKSFIKLGDLINHPDLFEAYPELKDMPVHKEMGQPGIYGQYDPSSHTITTGGLTSFYKPTDPYDAYSTLLHEINHAISHREGRPVGGNPQYANQLQGTIIDRKLGLLNDRIDDINDQLSKLDDTSNEAMDLKKQRWDIRDRKKEIINSFVNPFEAYQRLQDEVLSRLVQRRHGLLASDSFFPLSENPEEFGMDRPASQQLAHSDWQFHHWGKAKGGRTMGNNAIGNAMRMALGGDAEIEMPHSLKELQDWKKNHPTPVPQPSMDDIFTNRVSGFEGAPPMAMPANLAELQAYARAKHASGGHVDDITHALNVARHLGRGNDTILAHINPQEAALLKAHGGSGKINPYTGLMEFDEGDTKDSSSDTKDSSSDNSGNDNVRADALSQNQQTSADTQAAIDRAVSQAGTNVRTGDTLGGLTGDTGGSSGMVSAAQGKIDAATAAAVDRAQQAREMQSRGTPDANVGGGSGDYMGNVKYSVADVNKISDQIGGILGVNPKLIQGMIKNESGYNLNAIGSAGEVGLMQVKPSTYMSPGYGVTPGTDVSNLANPYNNVDFATRYLLARSDGADLSTPEGQAKALAAYNSSGSQAARDAYVNATQAAMNQTVNPEKMLGDVTINPANSGVYAALAKGVTTADQTKTGTADAGGAGPEARNLFTNRTTDATDTSGAVDQAKIAAAQPSILERIFGSNTDQIAKLENAGQTIGGDRDTVAAQLGVNPEDLKARIVMDNGQQKVDYYTKDLGQAVFGDAGNALSTGISNLFNKTGYDPTTIGNGMGNIQGVSSTNNITGPFDRSGNSQKIIDNALAVAAPSAPSAPVAPYTTQLSPLSLQLPSTTGLTAQQWADQNVGGDLSKVNARIKYVNGAPRLEYYTV